MNHRKHMKRALELAGQGIGIVGPNPTVGAVLVQDGRVIGEGFHKGPGTVHAEISAIESAKEPVEGATLYTSLEPCCAVYEGKSQPPCTERIISEGIKRVFIASIDPNPHVKGKGIKRLQSKGIEVTAGISEIDEKRLNEVFHVNQTEHRPFVHIKIAQTMDGRIATATGDSKWITDEDARRDVHRFRSHYDAVLIGAETVRKDNPRLTVRLEKRDKNIKRIILSRSLLLDPDSKIFNDQESNPTYIITSPSAPESQKKIFRKKGVRIIECRLDPPSLVGELYQKGISSIFVEGGSTVYTAFLNSGVFDRLSIYTAPVICGEGIQSIGELKTDRMNHSLSFERTEFRMINNQTVFHGWRR